MSESKEFRWGKCLKIGSRHALFQYFLEKSLPLKKNNKRYSIFCNRNKNTCQFHVFMIKNDFRNMSERVEFRFENTLKLLSL